MWRKLPALPACVFRLASWKLTPLIDRAALRDRNAVSPFLIQALATTLGVNYGLK